MRLRAEKQTKFVCALVRVMRKLLVRRRTAAVHANDVTVIYNDEPVRTVICDHRSAHRQRMCACVYIGIITHCRKSVYRK